MEWRLLPSVMTKMSLKRAERKKRSHASDVRSWATTQVNARKNRPKRLQRKGQICFDKLTEVRQKMEWRLLPSVMTKKSLKRAERKKRSHASDVSRWATTKVNARKNCTKRLQRKGHICLYSTKTAP